MQALPNQVCGRVIKKQNHRERGGKFYVSMKLKFNDLTYEICGENT